MHHRTRFNLIYSWPIFCFHSRCNPRLQLRQRPFASTCFTVYISFVFPGEVRVMSSCGFLMMWPIHLHLLHLCSLITASVIIFITMLRWMATLFPFLDQVFHFEDLWFSSLKPLSSWKISYLFTQASYETYILVAGLFLWIFDWIGCDFQSFIKFFFTSFMSSSESLVHWLIFSVNAFPVFSLWYIKHSDLIIPIIHKKCLRSLPSQKIPTICSPFLY